MDYRKMYRDIDQKLRSEGYETRFERNHKHPRVYIRCPGSDQEVMALLSTTSNYDQGTLYNIKWQDIRKCLKGIPTPEVHVSQANDLAKNLAQNVAAMNPNHPSLKQETQTNTFVEDPVSYPIKIFLFGKKLALLIDKSVVAKFPHTHIRVDLTASKHLIIAFYHKGAEPKKFRNPDVHLYTFERGDVPFAYTTHLERGELGTTFVRRKGDSLVTSEPLPSTLLGVPQAPALTTSAKADEGKAALRLFNEWLKHAYDAGMEPEVQFDGKHTVKVLIAEKRKVEI